LQQQQASINTMYIDNEHVVSLFVLLL
jgi:hypothetical protein